MKLGDKMRRMISAIMQKWSRVRALDRKDCIMHNVC